MYACLGDKCSCECSTEQEAKQHIKVSLHGMLSKEKLKLITVTINSRYMGFFDGKYLEFEP